MFSISRRRIVAGVTALSLALSAPLSAVAQDHPDTVKIGMLLTLSGIWARPGQSELYGAELAVKHINEAGGIKALGGAKLELVVMDVGDNVERAKNAAQRLIAEEPDLVAASGAVISSLTLAASEVTERAKLPLLTLSYSDQITDRGFQYIFQTSATGETQARLAMPELMKLAESAGKTPKTVGIIMDNTAANYAFVEPMKNGIFAEHGLELVLDEVYTPPLSDATPIVQKLRSARPDVLLLLAIAVSDVKLLLEKMSEFGLGQGKIPIISNGNGIAEPNVLDNMDAALTEGVMSVIGNFGGKGQEKLAEELKVVYNEPWVVQGPVSGYGTVMIIKEALEMAGKADREAVAEALRTMDLTDGPAFYFPGGRVKFDEKGRRVDAGLVIVQWQNGVPVTVYPPELAVAKAFWP
ncbi:ABC transporter substrate-binding protein [Chelativorans sp. SCAU2101]|uniref:ABC transporter substrate-binding protein n=1 Tax=Chelativorans petroleitrophicus TaxID=2975484 RepID=A0A9X3B8L7_9HYPH|nr:ABC transporter substrate-binding protein [Chelativorans petroleitrophicus]MCT8989076.1 ABC transporter substrate-binding protein [Chelativorans petroleitrophicus]